jgi:hypothetical protein
VPNRLGAGGPGYVELVGSKQVCAPKSYLAELPTNTVEGKLHFLVGFDDDDYTFTWVGGGDRTSCWSGSGGCEWRVP